MLAVIEIQHRRGFLGILDNHFEEEQVAFGIGVAFDFIRRYVDFRFLRFG